ncbi:HNH endonuclease signature motif containing protein [Paraburkholderia metrosideri]|uniref:HNH endonuclease signature motif containing protein n=1 Tax=Paraburkholderia metrosideri TaxID=580937 RepID=A0ABW9DTR0_9BURK
MLKQRDRIPRTLNDAFGQFTGRRGSRPGGFRTTRQKIEEDSIAIPFSGCWIWMGAIRANGYGKVQHKGRETRAHRASYEVFNGHVPDGLCVCHRCDVRACVNPHHLFLGTKKENTEDMMRKGRKAPAITKHGESSHLAKLAASDVLEIRSSASSALELSMKFGVTRTQIYAIRSRKAWAHI